MIVTLVLRLEAAAIAEGDLRGWAEVVATGRRFEIDGAQSVLTAALTARGDHGDAAPTRTGPPGDRAMPRPGEEKRP
jgi:hypothetical protein